jgi:hypothetical protein
MRKILLFLILVLITVQFTLYSDAFYYHEGKRMKLEPISCSLYIKFSQKNIILSILTNRIF